jgi:hypothetical protein
VKAPVDRLRDQGLVEALDAAIAGGAPARATLFDKLRRASGLPSPRMNVPVLRAFAAEAARRGPAVDALLAAMRALNEDVAPHGHVDEFLAVAGTAASAARAVLDPKARRALLPDLEEAACDMRARVRAEAALGLATLAAKLIAEGADGQALIRQWIDDDQPWLARSAVVALASDEALAAFTREQIAELLLASFQRLAREHRAGRRHEAYRRFAQELETLLAPLVARLPALADVLVAATNIDDEDVRRAIEAAMPAIRKGRAQDRAPEIDAALVATKKPSRDPRWDRLPGKRGRGK